MDVWQAISSRRSVKKFDPEYRLSDVDLEKLLSHAVLAPTAFNIQNWRIVNVSEPQLRQSIRKVAWNQAQVTEASLLLVLCADLRAWEKEPQRYWVNAPQEAQDFILPAIDNYYRDKPQVQRDEAMRSCGIIAQNIMLTARGMALDTCPMDGFDFDAVGELINLPEDHVISLMIVVGKPLEAARPRGGQLPLDQIVVTDHF